MYNNFLTAEVFKMYIRTLYMYMYIYMYTCTCISTCTMYMYYIQCTCQVFDTIPHVIDDMEERAMVGRAPVSLQTRHCGRHLLCSILKFNVHVHVHVGVLLLYIHTYMYIYIYIYVCTN